jgi:hypothetical protein
MHTLAAALVLTQEPEAFSLAARLDEVFGQPRVVGPVAVPLASQLASASAIAEPIASPPPMGPALPGLGDDEDSFHDYRSAVEWLLASAADVVG